MPPRSSATSTSPSSDPPETLDAVTPTIGDVVVHEDHGIARLDGLVALDDGAREAVRLVYADGATLIVPIEDIDRIWRHGGDGDRVRLDRLDTDSWATRRREIETHIAETARALETRMNTRARLDAPAIVPDEKALARFAAGFPHTLTPDQARAVAETLADLARDTPMDRLICGDVGFGKTEIALRAAAATVLAGRQVAIVAPTTVLARQHAETFAARFAETGVEVVQVSRLVPPARAREARAAIADGSAAVAVGTQALAGKDVRFRDLGLVVVDEEQRFGARQKTALERLRAGAHVLTLTATPIPATFVGALVGLRALSRLTTPPPGRKPIETRVEDLRDEIVREALLAERERGGRSFVVVPRIADMAGTAERLGRAVPNLRVAQVHGRMPAAEIADVMLAFASGANPPDVLLTTDIVESGLDVPGADTMLVLHPERFGLGQLHQLRGRVGRGTRQATCLLLVDPDADLREATRARLEALAEETRLGAGFDLAARDLDLRGAGEILGEEQAGHAEEIGIGLLADLLERASAAARGEPLPETAPVHVEIGLHGAIPADRLPEPDERLAFYARLARVADEDALDAVEAAIDERIGVRPGSVTDLLELARLRLRCRALGILRLDGGPAGIAATLRDETVSALERFTTRGPLNFDGNRLVLDRETQEGPERLDAARTLVEAIETALAEAAPDDETSSPLDLAKARGSVQTEA